MAQLPAHIFQFLISFRKIDLHVVQLARNIKRNIAVF